MTPCEEKGYKVGDEFVVSNPRASKVHRKGVRVRLCEDDGISAPYFEAVFKKDRDDTPKWVFDLGDVSPFSEHGIITRTNGQPFATEASARQQLTTKGLQGTHEVLSHEGGYALAPINRDDDPITLRSGDYVSTEGMTEEQYHAVARAFMAAGARHADWENQIPLAFFGWSKDEGHNGLLLQSAHGAANEFSRHLTIDQVLGATNAGTTTPKPEETTMTTDPIATLKQARQARDEAEKAYQEALGEAREYLGEGFELTEVGTDGPLVDGEYMADPANWREGDVLECVETISDTKKGNLYTLETDPSDGELSFRDDAGDFCSTRLTKLRFHHRPA